MGCSSSNNIISNKGIISYAKKLSIVEKDGESGPYINYNNDNIDKTFIDFSNKSFFSLLAISLENGNSRQCLGYRRQIGPDQFENRYTWFNYKQVQQMSTNFAFSLKYYSLTPIINFDDEGPLKLIGIFSRNCVEWSITDIGSQMDSITSVALYATLGELAFEHIIHQTQITTLCLSPENIRIFLRYKQNLNLSSLTSVIVFDLTLLVDKEEIQVLQNAGLKVYLFTELIKKQAETKIIFNSPSSDTLYTISYTSGTTALPKGVKITQSNVYAQTVNHIDSGVNMNKNDVHLSYLPLSHIMERIAVAMSISKGGRVGFISGDVKKYFATDMKMLAPTIIFGVPKVLANIRNSIIEKISLLTGMKKSLAEKGLRTKRMEYKKTGNIKNRFYDNFVFSKIRDGFGGKMRVIITGSAPLPTDLADDLKILFSVPIVEAYGMTELSGAATLTHMSDLHNMGVGGPIKTAMVKLVDVPEMNYHSQTLLNDLLSPSGEICVKGPIQFTGYFRNIEETLKTIDQDGWVHTGDVGRILPENSCLKIIDRIKEMFKLSQGEYIAPAKLESVYSKSPYVFMICIYGNSLKNYCIAIIQPVKEKIEEFFKNKGKVQNGDPIENYYNDIELIEEVKRSLIELADLNKFNSLEKPMKILLSPDEFTISNGMVTPTLKLVRRKIYENFADKIEELYNS